MGGVDQVSVKAFIRDRSLSLLIIVAVLLVVVLTQAEIFFSISFGRLEHYEPSFGHGRIWLGWIGLRAALITACIGLWLLNRKRTLVRTIALTNGVLTVGLILNVAALSATLIGFSARDVSVLLVDVVEMAASNILIFSVWYWVIDPPGIDANRGHRQGLGVSLPAASKPPAEL